MKKIIILVTVSTLSLFANMDKTLKISYSTINSTSDEIVYDTDGSKVSHLYWRLDNVPLVGISGTLVSTEQVALNASFYKNISTQTSTMDDYDWIDGDTPSSLGYTQWSHHEDTDVKEVTRFDINVQGIIAPTFLGNIYGILGYKKDTFEWTANGGFYEYSSNNFERIYIEDTQVISYSQYMSTTYIGIGIVNDYFKRFKFDANIKYSNNVDIEGKDIHHVKYQVGNTYYPVYYDDYCDDASLLDYTISASYSFTKYLSTYISYNYTKTTIAKGYTHVENTYTNSSGDTSDDTAGSAYESKMYTFGIKVEF